MYSIIILLFAFKNANRRFYKHMIGLGLAHRVTESNSVGRTILL